MTFLRTWLDPRTDKPTIIMGDFNFPSRYVSWHVLNADIIPELHPHDDSTYHCLEMMTEMSADYFLCQKVSSPTRGESILDLVFSSDPDMITAIDVCPTSISDHHMVSFVVETGKKLTHKPTLSKMSNLPDIAKFDFQEADWDLLKASINQEELVLAATQSPSMELCLDNIVASLATTCTAAGVPLKKSFSHKAIIPRVRRCLFRKKCKASRQLARCTSEARFQALTKRIMHIDQEITNSIKKEMSLVEEKAINDIKSNPKTFISLPTGKEPIDPKLDQ